MSYALFLDDIRTPMSTKHVEIPSYNWVVIKNYKLFVKEITENGLPYFISFDHDLSFEHYPVSEQNPNEKIPYESYEEKTGYHCAKFLIEYCQNKNLKLPAFQVHSMNIVGKENILSILNHFKRFQEENK